MTRNVEDPAVTADWEAQKHRVCRCGHMGGDHDAGECWADVDGRQCGCAWAEFNTTQRDELLTPAELRVIDLSGQLAGEIATVVGTRSHDLTELVHHIHAIQHAMMAQAAARAYPDRFRLLGGGDRDGTRPGA